MTPQLPEDLDTHEQQVWLAGYGQAVRDLQAEVDRVHLRMREEEFGQKG